MDDVIRRSLEGSSEGLSKLGFKSTQIFYSNPWLTLRPGRYYLAGQNPGGTQDIPSQTFADLDAVGRDRPWSKYLDEANWQHDPLQRHLRQVADGALPGGKEALREVFCTNTLFCRDNGQMKAIVDYALRECWPWHEEFLSRVKPSVILAIGSGKATSAYTLWQQKLHSKREDEPFWIEGTYYLKVSRGRLLTPHWQRRVRLVGLPHLSRPFSEAALDRLCTRLRNEGLLDDLPDD